MLKREIEICGKKIPFRSSATVPRLYRAKFKRDIFKDLSKLEKSYKGKTEDGDEFQIDDLEIFENVAYIMAYHADNSIPASIDDWLDQFDMFSIYEVLPQILEPAARRPESKTHRSIQRKLPGRKSLSGDDRQQSLFRHRPLSV